MGAYSGARLCDRGAAPRCRGGPGNRFAGELRSSDAADPTSEDRARFHHRPALLMGKWKPARIAAMRPAATTLEARVGD